MSNPLTTNDLKRLKELALKEHKDFFKRNPHLKEAYCDSLIGICLCQGAASYYIRRKGKIRDFDIWHFYAEKKGVKFPYRAIWKNVKIGGKPIDFLKRAISKNKSSTPEQNIMKYLYEIKTPTRKLLEKPIIGLFPNEIFGKVLHNPL